MSKQDQTHLKFNLNFVYYGKLGYYPSLDLVYITKDGKECNVTDYVSKYKDGTISDDDFKKTIVFSKILEKYLNAYITSLVYVDESSNKYMTNILADFRSFEYLPYENMLECFSKCVADIYYDFNGDKFGFAMNNKDKIKLDIQIGPKIIKLSNPVDTIDNRIALAQHLCEIIDNIVTEIKKNNAKKSNTKVQGNTRYRR